MRFENIVWSDKSYTLKAFVDSESFPLPQVVKVESGIYSEEEAKTLTAGQILTLHFTKKTDKVRARPTGRKEFFIPVNFPCKVEILPEVCDDVYYSVQEVVDATWVKFIRAVHNSPPAYRLKAGDILEIKKTVVENRTKFIECEFVNKTRDNVKLPLDYKAAFEPLEKAEQYDFLDALHRFKLPLRVKFISSQISLNALESDAIDWPPVGSVLLREKLEESTVICTSRAEGIVTVLMIPSDLDVSVNPALGALTKDEEYVRFCKTIHDGADLKKAETDDLFGIRDSKPRSDEDLEVLYDYVEVKPVIPPRSREAAKNPNQDLKPTPRQPPRPRLRNQPEGSEETRSTENTIKPTHDEVPPPRPPRTESLGENTKLLPLVGNRDVAEGCHGDSDEDYLYPDIDDEDAFSSSAAAALAAAANDDDDESDYINLPDSDIDDDDASPSKPKATGSPSSSAGSPRVTPYAIAPFSSSSPYFPDDLSCLSVREVGHCLEKLHLGRYVEAFESRQIDGEMLAVLNDESFLISVGVSDMFDRKKLMKFILGWRPRL